MSFTLNRRSVLAGLAATAACSALESPVHAATQPFFQRVGLPIGLQLYTLGEEVGPDIDATFAAIAALGYRELQMSQLYGKTPAEMAAIAARAGLAISSLHLSVSTQGEAEGPTLASDPAEIGEAFATLGATIAALPIMPFPAGMARRDGEDVRSMIVRSIAEAGADLWKRTAATLNEKAAALKPHGVKLGYHNHNMEFAPVPGTDGTGMDILIAETDPDLVGFEVDVGWVATAGLDPVAFLDTIKGRAWQLHVKDVAATNTKNYGLAMQPAEIGAGTLDWSRVLPAAYDAGVRHFYVEQEPPFAIARMEAIRINHDYLAALKA